MLEAKAPKNTIRNVRCRRAEAAVPVEMGLSPSTTASSISSREMSRRPSSPPAPDFTPAWYETGRRSRTGAPSAAPSCRRMARSPWLVRSGSVAGLMITLVLGGARSGKSTYAERLMGRLPSPITYVATLLVGDDQDLSARVARHRSRRPDDWCTLEAGLDLPGAVRAPTGAMVPRSLGSWGGAPRE